MIHQRVCSVFRSAIAPFCRTHRFRSGVKVVKLGTMGPRSRGKPMARARLNYSSSVLVLGSPVFGAHSIQSCTLSLSGRTSRSRLQLALKQAAVVGSVIRPLHLHVGRPSTASLQLFTTPQEMARSPMLLIQSCFNKQTLQVSRHQHGRLLVAKDQLASHPCHHISSRLLESGL